MMRIQKSESKEFLPSFFKPIFWSYNFSLIDPEKDKKLIVINTINYGDLKHWRWLINAYGKEGVRSVLERISSTEIRLRVQRLAAIIFDIKNFHYVPRGPR